MSKPTAPETQPDLFTASPVDANVQWFENMLKGAGCWLTVRDIQLSTHGKVNDRELRKLASASLKVISSDKGYKFIEHASAQEIDHSANRLESQGKKMLERSIALRQYAHALLG